jgi:hypothetical protein
MVPNFLYDYAISIVNMLNTLFSITEFTYNMTTYKVTRSISFTVDLGYIFQLPLTVLISLD